MKERCDRLNSYLCKRYKTSGDIKFLASPVTGGTVGLDIIRQLFLLYYKEVKHDADSMAETVWRIFSSQGQLIITKEKRLETPDENIAELKSLANSF